MRALVTGAGGFVGKHLVAALLADGWDVFKAGGHADENVDARLDVRNRDAVRDVVALARPDAVFHLAARSFVPDSLSDPCETYETNVIGAANIAEALRRLPRLREAPGGSCPRLLFVSSAEVYGNRDASEMPMRETLAPQPANPYAASKAAAEAILLGEMQALGGDVVVARAFNHIGPGQSERFAIAGFALDLARIAAGGEKILYAGNLDAERDFLDVRDVVRAYVALAKAGTSGEIYNVCSAKAIALHAMLGELIRIANVPVEIRTDPERMRPAEIATSVGSNEKLTSRTGWSPRYTIAQSLRDIYADARNRTGL